MDKKLTNKTRDNIIYLSEDDAKALGIYYGETESIFVDGKKVSLSFIDEHEIFDATAEERRIVNNALNLRQKELEAKFGTMDPNAKSSYLVPYGTIVDEEPTFDSTQESTKGNGFFGTIKIFFSKKYKHDEDHAQDMLVRSKYGNRTDIFTDEEIQIIQEVISRAHGVEYTQTYTGSRELTKPTNKRKKRKVRTQKVVKEEVVEVQPEKKEKKKKLIILKNKFNKNNALRLMALKALKERDEREQEREQEQALLLKQAKAAEKNNAQKEAATKKTPEVKASSSKKTTTKAKAKKHKKRK